MGRSTACEKKYPYLTSACRSSGPMHLVKLLNTLRREHDPHGILLPVAELETISFAPRSQLLKPNVQPQTRSGKNSWNARLYKIVEDTNG
jgi:hypothetical protein